MEDERLERFYKRFWARMNKKRYKRILREANRRRYGERYDRRHVGEGKRRHQSLSFRQRVNAWEGAKIQNHLCFHLFLLSLFCFLLFAV